MRITDLFQTMKRSDS